MKKFYTTILGKICLTLLFIATCFQIYVAYIKYTSRNIENCLNPYQSQEFEEAYKSCSTLANNGDILAKLVIGDMYANGYHVQKDYNAAEALFIEVANNQFKPEAHKLAYNALGDLYFRKDFAKHNIKKSFNFVKLAADNGMNIAQLRYGIALFIGYGVDKNSTLAKKYILDASKNGLKDQAEQTMLLINSPDADAASQMLLEDVQSTN